MEQPELLNGTSLLAFIKGRNRILTLLRFETIAVLFRVLQKLLHTLHIPLQSLHRRLRPFHDDQLGRFEARVHPRFDAVDPILKVDFVVVHLNLKVDFVVVHLLSQCTLDVAAAVPLIRNDHGRSTETGDKGFMLINPTCENNAQLVNG